jgi:hypothetical protein
MDKKYKRLFPVAVMCKVLKVSTSVYYDSIKRQPSEQYIRRKAISQAAAKSYFESNRISDRGVQYVCEDFQDMLQANNIEMFYNNRRRYTSLGHVSLLFMRKCMKEGRNERHN